MASASPGFSQGQQSAIRRQSEDQQSGTTASSHNDSPDPWISVEQDQKPFQCGLCSMSFAVNMDLVSHVHNHSFTKPYQCGYCKMSYNNNPQLIVHVKLHTFLIHVHPSSTSSDNASHPVQTILPLALDSNPSGLFSATETSQPDVIANANESLHYPEKPDVTACSKPHFEGSDNDMAIIKTDLNRISSEPIAVSSGNAEPLIISNVESEVNHETLWNSEKKVKAEHVDDDEVVESGQYTGILEVKTECTMNTSGGGGKSSESGHMDKRTFRCKGKYQKPFHCDICGVTFKAARYVKDHKRRSHKISFAITQSCHKQSYLQDDVGGRSESVQDSGRWESKVLQEPDTNTANKTEVSGGRTVVTDSTFVTKRKSNAQKCFTCSDCGKISKNKHSLNRHKLIVHSNIRSFPCSLCSKRLKTKTSLNDHMSFIHSDERPFPCSYCPRRFKKKFGLVAHVARVHENHRPFPCPHCKASFGAKGELTSHVNRKHNTEAPHQCTDCGKCFKVKDSLRQHFCKPKECPICSCVLNCPKSYNYHMQQHNYSTPREYFQCKMCVFRGVVTKDEVDVHTKSHENQRPYICEFCGQSFTRKIYLNYHQNSAHFNNRPYKCDICQKEFTSHPNLAQHRRRHLDYKKYACDQCDKRFYTYSNLQRHAITHTDLRMHACSVCGKTYRSHSNLSYHMKHSHPP